MGYQGYTAQPGWRGIIVFAATLMMLSGVMNVVYGIVALVNADWEGWSEEAEALLVDLTTWGWVHVVAGAALFLAGLGVLYGNRLARAVGVVVAAISALTNFFFIPAQPIWSLTIVVMDLVIIWALTAHGGEMRET